MGEAHSIFYSGSFSLCSLTFSLTIPSPLPILAFSQVSEGKSRTIVDLGERVNKREKADFFLLFSLKEFDSECYNMLSK